MLGKRERYPEDTCPLLGESCIQARCRFWTHVRGKHPQTGADLDMPDCAVRWLPVLLIEGAKEMRQAGAAVESFRNEMVRQNDEFVRLVHDRAHPIRSDRQEPRRTIASD